MKWTIKLEFTPDGGETITHDIGTITRPIADLRPEEIGLTSAEGHEVVRDIERRMIGDQIHAYTLCFRRCPHCGQRQPFKDVRTKCVLTLFGAYRLRGRRTRLCRCQVDRGCASSFFPLGQIIPRRTTPEVRHLFAQLGATMPYREASWVMKVFGFASGRSGRMAIWRHTVAAGRQIEGDRFAAIRGRADGRPIVRRLLIGIDDTYIRHRRRDASRQIQVTAGRFECDGKLGDRFAFVRSAPNWRPAQLQGILNEQGAETCDCVQVMTDGDDGLRNFVQRAIRIPIEPQLDWFHIGMRLERLRKIVQLPVNYNEYRREPNAFDPMTRRVERVRRALWHGRVPSALDHLTALHHELNLWSTSHPDSAREALTTTIRAIEEFGGYVGGNRRGVPNFAKARAAGRRISTAHIESVMNHLVNHRLGKRQQMRWSPAGAHYLLQVRVESLNGTLLDRFRRWHERIQSASRYMPCAA
jgi:hypothetical protein